MGSNGNREFEFGNDPKEDRGNKKEFRASCGEVNVLMESNSKGI